MRNNLLDFDDDLRSDLDPEICTLSLAIGVSTVIQTIVVMSLVSVLFTSLVTL